jgi:hypothetical protein
VNNIRIEKLCCTFMKREYKIARYSCGLCGIENKFISAEC